MAVRPIRLFPDSILATPCAPVKHDDPNLPQLIQDLLDTMYRSPGVGLAAPQIGILKRVSVVDCSRTGKKDKNASAARGPLILINPELLEARDPYIPREGCLSVPDLLANVSRFKHVVVRSTNLDGNHSTIRAVGLEALALQHELDHLEGKLFLDRVANLKTDLFRRKSY